MGFPNLDFKEGLGALADKFPKNPWGKKPDHRSALNKNDYADGMLLQEYEFYNGEAKPSPMTELKLQGSLMPHQPFKTGGKQKIVSEYYPGQSEPTVQILGAQENAIVAKGRWFSKKYKYGNETEQRQYYRIPTALKETVERMRRRGNLIVLTMGEYRRYCFIQEATFEEKTQGDISWEITFFVVGFNKPKNCRLLKKTDPIPYDLNEELLNKLAILENLRGKLPPEIKRSFADQLNGLISDVAKAVNFVTGFVDTVLNEVDDIKAGVNRAIGLVKNARTKVCQTQRRLASFTNIDQPETGSKPKAGISTKYNNKSYISQVGYSLTGLAAILATMQAQLKLYRQITPLGRYRVISGDTLQKIAMKYYSDADKWGKIYDHNKLTSTELVIGTVLEIPRV